MTLQVLYSRYTVKDRSPQHELSSSPKGQSLLYGYACDFHLSEH